MGIHIPTSQYMETTRYYPEFPECWEIKHIHGTVDTRPFSPIFQMGLRGYDMHSHWKFTSSSDLVIDPSMIYSSCESFTLDLGV